VAKRGLAAVALLYALGVAVVLGWRSMDRVAEPREPEFAGQAYVETGDLEAIRARGRLRILVGRSSGRYLPRDVDPLLHVRELARAFGESVGAPGVLVYVDTFDDLIPALLAGRGDIVSDNLTVTKSRKEVVAFTLPLASVQEIVVGRAEDAGLSSGDLAGRTLAVRRGTSLWERALELEVQQPELLLRPLSPTLSSAEVLDAVAAGELDLTLEDSHRLAVELRYRPRLRVVSALPGRKNVAWAVRPQNKELLGALNSFLTVERLNRERSRVYRGDLPELRRRRVVRLLTRNNPASYFLWRGELVGFEYDLVRWFAEEHSMRVQVVVAPSHDELIPMLVEGRGDLAAAFLTPTDERRAMGVAFSRPYLYSTQVVVGRAAEGELGAIGDLTGRRVYARRSSSYWQTLTGLRARGAGFELHAAPEDLDLEEIIDRVASGRYDLTVADDLLLNLELTHRDDVKAVLTLGERRPAAWAVREEDEELLAAIDAFLKRQYRGERYNLTYRRYFESRRRMKAFKEDRFDPSLHRFTPYDEVVRRHARRFGLDWRLIMAVMYEESRFDPDAVSWAGARGLLQVMPRTALEFGFDDLADPETGILAGIRYLATLRDSFDTDLYAEDRLWFALAGYNAGPGHVWDAIRLAREQGWNTHRWFGHVETAMLRLSRPANASRARHGYLDGRRPVGYVRRIRRRYGEYVQLTHQWERPATIGR